MTTDTLQTATDNGGTQSNTQSPQSSAPAFSGGTPSQAVQPGAASALNTSGNTSAGIPLAATALPAVNLANASTSASASTQAVPAVHRIQPVWAGFSVALFLLALGLFWITTKSAKSTTDY